MLQRQQEEEMMFRKDEMLNKTNDEEKTKDKTRWTTTRASRGRWGLVGEESVERYLRFAEILAGLDGPRASAQCPTNRCSEPIGRSRDTAGSGLTEPGGNVY